MIKIITHLNDGFVIEYIENFGRYPEHKYYFVSLPPDIEIIILGSKEAFYLKKCTSYYETNNGKESFLEFATPEKNLEMRKIILIEMGNFIKEYEPLLTFYKIFN